MAKVFLFNPPGPGNKRYIREGRCTQERGVWATQWPPLSLATAAALLERDGHTIRVVDFPAVGSNLGSLVEMVQEDQPHFAIWNAGTPSLRSDLSLARIIKEVAPEAITAIMGTEVTVHPDKALSLPCIDIVIRREPEQTIRNLCLHEDGEWAPIDGISYRDQGNGKIHHNPDAGFLPPEAIPAPAWRYLDIRPYCLPLKGRPFLIVAPIRGCPYPCSFCTAPIYYGKALRRRPIKDVVDEIEEDIRTFKVKDFFIWADTFTADREYVKRFCWEIIDRCLPVSWTCNSRVDTVDGELLALMKRAGLWMISFGVESGNNEILQSTGKNITAEQSREALSLTSQLGIRASGHFIFGLPEETEKTMEETLAFALDVPLDITQFYTAAPFPGTALHAQALRKGWLRGNRSFSQSRAVMDLPGLPAHRVDKFRRYAYRRFYMRAGTLWRLVSMVEFEAIGNILRDMTYFFQWVRS